MNGANAVVVAFWPGRYKNVTTIVESLMDGSERPDSITIVNNHPYYFFPPTPWASVINCGRNFTSRSKYGVALLDPKPYYLLLDDDTGVHPKCLSFFLEYADEGACFAPLGFQIDHNYLSASTIVHCQHIETPTSCNAFNGNVQFLSFGAIVNMLKAEKIVRFVLGDNFKYIGEDILVGMANPDTARILPQTSNEQGVSTLSLGGEAMQWDPGYYQTRDWFAHQAWVLLGNKPFAGPVPGEDENERHMIERYMNALEKREASLEV